MSYLYKFFVLLIILAAGYSIFGIVHFKWMYHNVENPAAEFQVSGDKKSDIVFVEFLNYGCGYCKELRTTMGELQQVRKDIRFVIRPIPFDTEEAKDQTTRLALAAGLQGKFTEFHEAFLEYPESIIPDEFVQETAALYGVDYNQLKADAAGKKVEKLATENFNALEHANLYGVPSFMIDRKIYSIEGEELPALKQFLTIIPTN